MRFLLDTHAFLWFIAGDPKLSQRARQLIEDVTNDRFVSIASFWETAIKVSKNRLTLFQPFEILIPQHMGRNGFLPLGITFSHTVEISKLPPGRTHLDPFDRLLVAQAIVEQISIISIDDKLDDYGIHRIW